VYELIVHCAYNVTAVLNVKDVGENAVPFQEYEVPEPFAAVFQPENV
jgi:hypothetical protein